MNSQVIAVAMENLLKLSRNPYPGRGIVIGTSQCGKYAIQVCWTMGRGEKSRNRVYGVDGSRLFTEAADPSKMTPEDAKNIIYNAMRESVGKYLASNGDQTDSAMWKFGHQECLLSEALTNRTYEDDAPNFTPRITGLCDIRDGGCTADLHIIRKSELTAELITHGDCQHFHFRFGHIIPGFGFCITTYLGDGNPLPAFTGEPYPVPLHGSMTDVLWTFWRHLNEENRVSIAVKLIEIATGKSKIAVINKYKKVIQPSK